MKARISVEEFSTILSLVEPVVSGGDSPIKRAFHIVARDGGMYITGSNTLLMSTRYVQAQIDQPGEVCIDGKSLYQFCNKLPKGKELTLTASRSDDGTSDNLLVTCVKSKFKVPLLDPASLPQWSRPAPETSFTLSAADLHGLISPVSHAMMNDSTRPQFNGICLLGKQADGSEGIRAVATDGHRLTVRSLEAAAVNLPEKGIIVPRESIRHILRFVEKSDRVSLTADDTVIELACGENRLISKLVADRFVDYPRLIPDTIELTLTMAIEDLKPALDRVSVIGSKTSRVEVKVDLEALELKSFDEGQTGLEVVDLFYKLNDLESARNRNIGTFTVNARYILDAIENFTTQLVDIHIQADQKPFLVKPHVLNGENKSPNMPFELIMPMR